MRSPWGGGNQWLIGFIKYLENIGYHINYKLGSRTCCVFIMNSKALVNSWRARRASHVTFGIDELKKFKMKFPSIKCIQRINDSDMHRGSSNIDNMFQKVNQFCDYTVFISNWILKYHSDKWFTKNKYYTVINNAADSEIFNPIGGSVWDNKQAFKIVTHHWSNNPQKGFYTYKALDDLIYKGTFENTELYIVGNYPEEIKWSTAKIYNALFGVELADLLRSCHAYITASRFEASGMHFIEGLQCGLPVLYSKDGGSIAESGKIFGVPIDKDLPKAVNKIKKNYNKYRISVLQNSPSSEKMHSEYLEVFKTAMG